MRTRAAVLFTHKPHYIHIMNLKSTEAIQYGQPEVKIIGTRTVTSLQVYQRSTGKTFTVIAIMDNVEKVTVELTFVDGYLLVCKEPLYETVRQCDASSLPEPKGSFYRIKWWLSTKGYRKDGGRNAFRAKRVNGKSTKGGYVYLKVTQFIDEGDIIHENIKKKMPNVSLDKLMEKYTKMADILYEVIADTELGAYVRECLGMTDADARAVRARCLDTYGDKLQECISTESSLDNLRGAVPHYTNAEARACTLSREDIIKEAVNKKIAIWNGTIDLIDADIAKAKDTISQLCRTKRELQLKVSALNELVENK